MADITMPRARRVVIVDDHKFLVEMLVGELVQRGYEAMYVDVDDPELVAHLRELQPAMILLDAVFRDDEDAGLRVLCELREDHDIEVAIITGVADEIHHAEFLDHGAIAVVSKGNSLETVMDQIGDVLSGIDPHGARQRHDLAQKLEQHRSRIADHAKILDDLTSHERSTLQSLVDGMPVDQIALTRTVAESTVRSHIRSLFQKLNVHSQVEAIALGARHGMVPLSDDQPSDRDWLKP